ncbi:MAG TPA: tetratricopeptide repeat protein [Chloroflexia bacterium]|nr:tetratricopeptide repeat protein [Chloroflexia bacterium]
MSDSQKPPPRVPPEMARRIIEAARLRAELPDAAPAPPVPPAAAPPAPPPPTLTPQEAIREQAAALHRQAIAEIQAGDSSAARRHLEESLALERDIAVPADMAATLIMLGQVLFSQNERDPGLALARESLAIFRSRGAPEAAQVQEIVTQMEALVRQDAAGGSRDLLRQGIAALQAGDGEVAGELLDQSLQAAVAAGDGAVAAAALHHLGLLLFSAGHLEQAEAALRDSMELNRTLADEPSLAAGLALLGQVLVARDQRPEGLRLLRESMLTWKAANLPEQAAQVKELIAEIKAAATGPPAD